MQHNTINGIVFYQSAELLQFPGVVHAVTTRHGGVSPAPFNTLNLGATVGDTLEYVHENLDRFHRALGLERTWTVDAAQAQADHVAHVTAAERGTRIHGVDGLITNVPGIPLMLRFADCVPILLYDPMHHAIGIAHAGWRGTVSKVLTNTVNAMGQEFATQPAELVACVGPSVGPCCYEIGTDVRDRVLAAFPDSNHELLHQNGALYLDLWQANALQLHQLGVTNLEIARVCTSDHTDDFYSWRRERAQTGRFGAIIALKAQ